MVRSAFCLGVVVSTQHNASRSNSFEALIALLPASDPWPRQQPSRLLGAANRALMLIGLHKLGKNRSSQKFKKKPAVAPLKMPHFYTHSYAKEIGARSPKSLNPSTVTSCLFAPFRTSRQFFLCFSSLKCLQAHLYNSSV